jgi:hypothetical protein|tara:strand:- start:17 stop:154 length:138 start_codon:yes stop_codon:yes gene_type:complete
VFPNGSSTANRNLLLALQAKRSQLKNASKASFQAFLIKTVAEISA